MSEKLTVIIVDDAEYKRNSIKKYVSDIIPDVKFLEMDCARDFFYWLTKTGKGSFEHILSEPYEGKDVCKNNLLFLDWNFPFYKNERIEAGMGEEVLEHMQARDIVLPTIVVSSDDVVTDDENVLGTIKDDISVWLRPKYEELIKKYMESDLYEH